MTIFLALTPQSVYGPVKTEPLKQLEIDLLNTVNDISYRSYGSALEISYSPVSCWLVSTWQSQPKASFGSWAERETLKLSPYIWMWWNAVSNSWECVSGRIFEQKWKGMSHCECRGGLTTTVHSPSVNVSASADTPQVLTVHVRLSKLEFKCPFQLRW